MAELEHRIIISPPKRRAFLLALGLFLALTVLLILWQAWQSFREPVYCGKRVSSWLGQVARDGGQSEAWAVLYNNVGKDAIPALKRAVEQNDSPMRRAYRRLFPRLPVLVQHPLPKPRAREQFLMQIQGVLGKIGTPAIPIFARLFNDPDPKVRFRSLVTFAEMKGDKTGAIPALICMLEDTDFRIQTVVADVLGGMGPAAQPATPHLRSLLNGTSADVKVTASIALWRIDRDTNVLTVIIRNLKQSSRWAAILDTLSDMGPAARPSVENVLEAIPLWERHTNWGMWRPEIRDRVCQALAKIDPEAVVRVQYPPVRLGFGPSWMPN